MKRLLLFALCSCLAFGQATKMGPIAAKSINGTRFADQYAGADASIKINACLAEVLAAGGGTCDASGLGGVQTISQQINVSARSIGAGQWVSLKLPAYGTWDSTMSNPTGCVIKQFDHSSIVGQSSGQGQQMVIAARSGANVADVYCTDDAPTNGGSYIRAEGFSVRAYSGATIGRAVAEFRKLFDNSDIRDFTAVNGVAGTKAVWFWQVAYNTSFFNVSGEGGSAGIPCTIGNTNGAEASAATQGANFWLSCVHPGDGLNALVIAEGSTWTYANNIWNVYMEGVYPTDTTTAAIAVTNSGSASGANTIWNARLGSDNVGATRYLIDIAASAKLIVRTMSNSNVNYINNHTGSGITIAGSPNGTLASYSTDTGYLKSTVIFTGDSNAQFFDFGQGAGANPSASANVVAASQPRFEIKSTATSGGSSRSYLDFLDGNNDGYEQTFTADGANNPLEWYPITGLTRGSKMLSLDNAGLLGITSAKIGASGSTISDSRELIQSSHSCGTTTTCANTANQAVREIYGTVTLSTGAATLAGITAFTSTASFGCSCTDQTTAAACKAVPASTTSVTFAGTGSDVLFYRCVGN